MVSLVTWHEAKWLVKREHSCRPQWAQTNHRVRKMVDSTTPICSTEHVSRLVFYAHVVHHGYVAVSHDLNQGARGSSSKWAAQRCGVQLKGAVCSSKVRCAAQRCSVQLKGAVCQVHQHMFWHSLTLHSQLMGYVMGQDLTWSSSDEHLTPPFQHHYTKRKRA